MASASPSSPWALFSSFAARSNNASAKPGVLSPCRRAAVLCQRTGPNEKAPARGALELRPRGRKPQAVKPRATFTLAFRSAPATTADRIGRIISPGIRAGAFACGRPARGRDSPMPARPARGSLGGSIDYPTDCPATRAADSQSGRVVAGLVVPIALAGESTSAVAAPCPAAAGTSPTRGARRASLRWRLMYASRHWLEHDCALALR
jgi:hypothetical protein